MSAEGTDDADGFLAGAKGEGASEHSPACSIRQTRLGKPESDSDAGSEAESDSDTDSEAEAESDAESESSDRFRVRTRIRKS